ncbi:MAG: hypothetical protein QME40_00655 [bacterium]|nr:hypothetical protein [bacterium]
MKRCYEIQTCPASHYLRCPAYKTGKDCWETTDLPCCKRNNKDRCNDCYVYIKAKEGN